MDLTAEEVQTYLLNDRSLKNAVSQEKPEAFEIRFEKSRIIRWLKGGHDIPTPHLLAYFQRSATLQKLIVGAHFRKVVPIHSHADPHTQNRFVTACRTASLAYEERNKLKEALAIEEICQLLVNNFKFCSLYFSTNKNFFSVFDTSDSRTAAFANAHLATSLAFGLCVVGQVTAKCHANPTLAEYLHTIAGSLQFLSVLIYAYCERVPCKTFTLWSLGLLQLASDLNLPPTDALDFMPAWHTHGMRQFTRSLREKRLIHDELWRAAGSVDTGHSDSTMYDLMNCLALWGHYVAFTFVFLTRLRPRNLSSYFWVAICTASAAGPFNTIRMRRYCPPIFSMRAFMRERAQRCRLHCTKAPISFTPPTPISSYSGSAQTTCW